MRPITLKIPTGAFETVPRVGNYVRIGDSSPTVTVTDEDSGEFANLQAGDAVQFARPFRRLRVEHAEATTQTVVLDTGFGRIIAARINGEVQPIGGAANLAAPPTVYAADVAALLVDPDALRAPLIQLPSGASVGSATNASVVLVTAAANVNGVRLLWVNINSGGTSGAGTLDIAGATVFRVGGTDIVDKLCNVLVDAGQEVKITSSTAGCTVYCVYEVL